MKYYSCTFDENLLYSDEDKEIVYNFYKGAKAICKLHKAIGCLEFRQNSEKEGVEPHCIEFFLTVSE